VTDRILIEGMRFQGTHGVYEHEQLNPQAFEVDVELAVNLQPAGLSDDLTQTVDYSKVFDTCRQIVESTRFNLVEALAEAIAHPEARGPARRHVPRGRRGDPAPPYRLSPGDPAGTARGSAAVSRA
jgi:dihydroneopterin aldolase